MNRIYIDVTQSLSWRGRSTGIVRVMDELAIRFIDDNRFDPIFLGWDEGAGAFSRVDLKEALLNRLVTNEAVAAHQPSRLRRYSSRLLREIPAARKVYHKLKSARNKSKNTLLPNTHQVIEPGATLFMLHGGVWESERYIQYVKRLQKNKDVKLIPILFDLCPVLTPQFCFEGIRKVFDNCMRKVLPISTLIFAISENTAKDGRLWLKSLNKTVPPMKVFRLGDEIGGDDKTKPLKEKLPKEFILCVGTVEARKNHTSLYYAYKYAAQEGISLPPVIIAGRKGWLAENIYEIIKTDPETKDLFIFLHGKSDEEITWLYENCLFSVYPSFYEGWGLPIAESLLRGKLCLASNTSSIPEIAGDLIEYFSPYSPPEIAEKISKLSSNPKLVAEKNKKIRSDYKVTYWDDTYNQVADELIKLNSK